MTEDQRSIAYRNEKRMLQTGGKYSAGFARYDYALRNYKDVYTGGSRSVGYVRNTDREKQYARSVVNQQISNRTFKEWDNQYQNRQIWYFLLIHIHIN